MDNEEKKQAVVSAAREFCCAFLPLANRQASGEWILKRGIVRADGILFDFPFPLMVGIPEKKAVVIVTPPSVATMPGNVNILFNSPNGTISVWDVSVFDCKIVINYPFPAQGSP